MSQMHHQRYHTAADDDDSGSGGSDGGRCKACWPDAFGVVSWIAAALLVLAPVGLSAWLGLKLHRRLLLAAARCAGTYSFSCLADNLFPGTATSKRSDSESATSLALSLEDALSLAVLPSTLHRCVVLQMLHHSRAVLCPAALVHLMTSESAI